jgi:hypothetical protein
MLGARIEHESDRIHLPQAMQSTPYKCSGGFFAVINKLEPRRRNIIGVERREEADLNGSLILSAFEPDVHPLTEAELYELILNRRGW